MQTAAVAAGAGDADSRCRGLHISPSSWPHQPTGPGVQVVPHCPLVYMPRWQQRQGGVLGIGADEGREVGNLQPTHKVTRLVLQSRRMPGPTAQAIFVRVGGCNRVLNFGRWVLQGSVLGMLSVSGRLSASSSPGSSPGTSGCCETA